MSINQSRILLLTSNPKDLEPRLSLSSHIDLIQRILDTNRDMFNVRHYTARIRDIQRIMLDVNPHYVHFVGHGCDEGLWLENDNQEKELLDHSGIRGLFKGVNTAKCVLLMSCYTESISDLIGNYVEHVIGMKENIYMETGDRFAEGFYRSLVKGETVEKSFEDGKTNIQINNLQGDAPLLKRIKNRNRYQLKVSEKTFLTFQKYGNSSMSFQEYVQKIVANGIKSERQVSPGDISISNISFDEGTLTVLLPIDSLKKEDLSADFTDFSKLDIRDSGLAMKYVMTINELKDIHENFHAQIRSLQQLMLVTDRLEQYVFYGNGKSDSDRAFDISKDIKTQLSVYQSVINSFTELSKRIFLSTNPLIFDEKGNATEGPDWAMDVLSINNNIQKLFKQITPIRQTRDDDYKKKTEEFCEAVRDLNNISNAWLSKIDQQIKQNAIDLMAELMGW